MQSTATYVLRTAWEFHSLLIFDQCRLWVIGFRSGVPPAVLKSLIQKEAVLRKQGTQLHMTEYFSSKCVSAFH